MATITYVSGASCKGRVTATVRHAAREAPLCNVTIHVSYVLTCQSALQDQDQYYTSRADAMHTIESTIVELGGIFSQLATMVKEQEEMVTRIDNNIDDTALNVELGHNEILKYFQSVTSNRWLMVKIFGVLIFFFLLFVIFMA